MKKIFALLAVVLGVVSCQTEPEGLDVNVGGEQEVAICVSLPEATRANADSALGAFANVDLSGDATIRYILQIFDQNDRPSDAEYVKYSDEKSVVFPVRLVPNRDYRFVVWADYVDSEDAGDKHYNTRNAEGKIDLTNITLKDTWVAMDETRDAFTGYYDTADHNVKYSSTLPINITLKRPFAKLRVITTDMVELGYLGIKPPFYAEVEYATAYRVGFNAFESVAVAVKDSDKKTHNVFQIADYADNTDANKVLFTDYFFAENDVVKFTLSVYEDATKTKPIKSNFFNTDIAAKRNFLTTISGNILTDGNNVTVKVEDAFEDEKEWPEEGNSAQELAYAAMFGGEVTLTEDITLTQPLTIVDGANAVINLNGKTITGASVKGEGAIIENNGILTLVGGTIKNTETNGEAVIINNGELVLDGVKIEGAPMDNGSNYPEYAVKSSGKMTINNNTDISSYRGCIRLSGEGETIINEGVFTNHDITRNFTSHVVYVSGANKLTINGGTFSHLDLDTSGGVVICNATTGTIYINDGNFSGGKYFSGQHNLSDYGYGGKFSVKGGIFSDNISSKYIAEGYKAIAKDGKYVVVSNEVDNVVASKEDVQNALEAAVAAGETEVVIDANGANINLNYGLTKANVPAGTTVTIRNANVEGSCYGNGANGTVIFEGCTFNNSGAYSIHFDNGDGNVIFKNCALYGWNSFGSSLTSVSFENCTLDGNGTYALIRSYVDLTLTNCVINTSNADHNDKYSEGVEAIAPATLTENNVTYVAENPEALKAAIIKGGNIEFANDITVDEWIMISEDYNIGTGDIITVENINVSIDGKGHTLTVNAIESAGNGDQLFQSASVLNISNLTIKYADGLTTGGLGMDSGVIKNVHFIGGGSAASSAAIFPNQGEILVENCIFDTNGVAFYNDHECDNLSVTGCTFNQKDNKNVILLRGDVKFTNNIINSGRTVNVVSGSPVVTGNDFNDVRFKVYGAATATISYNKINNLEFDGNPYASTFFGNDLSAAAQAVLDAAAKAN
ncbi:MAG: hypothetical protein J6U69_07770 [Alistipes sp.]|nr:hypothetical protein [Alistipes sp.]